MIIDAQIHAYARPAKTLDASASGVVATMDRLGIDGSVLVSPWGAYRDDTTHAVAAYRSYPDRLRLVAPIDLGSPELHARVTRWLGTPGVAGVRLMSWDDDPLDPTDRRVRLVMRAAGAADLPVCLLCWGRLDIAAHLANAFPDTQIVIDHLGLRQPIHVGERITAPFRDIARILDLSRNDNVAVKVTGACTLSLLPFPFDDLWEPLGRIIETFGADRCMWGSDWTRTHGLVTPDEELAAFRDHWPGSDDERIALLGESAIRIFRWSGRNGEPNAIPRSSTTSTG